MMIAMNCSPFAFLDTLRGEARRRQPAFVARGFDAFVTCAAVLICSAWGFCYSECKVPDVRHGEISPMPSDPFVDVAALPSLGSIRYLDVRDQAAFDAGHAPGAVRVPVDAWDKAAKAADVGFENSTYWTDAFQALGLDQSVLAVAYDSGRMTDAARVWFILQYFGFKAAILNGGWTKMSSDSRLPSGAEASSEISVASPGVGSVGVVDRQSLKQDLDNSAANVFDTRTRAEFTGEDNRGRPRGGHLPGARHLSHVDLMEGGVVRPAPVLRQMLEEIGFAPGDHIVTHCEGGGRAALAAAAAARAGFDDVRVYYLSFADWARDESCPIIPG
jgi:thiosulfate/3-mercaptopyruvate sulfurtransferase